MTSATYPFPCLKQARYNKPSLQGEADFRVQHAWLILFALGVLCSPNPYCDSLLYSCERLK